MGRAVVSLTGIAVGLGSCLHSDDHASDAVVADVVAVVAEVLVEDMDQVPQTRASPLLR